MKIGNLKKVASLCRSKTVVLTARLLVLASLRRRIATVDAISHGIQTLMVATDQVANCDKAMVPRKGLAGVKKTAVHRAHTVDISNQLALFHQEDGDDGGCPNWTLHSVFDDDNCSYIDGYQVDHGDDDDDHSVFVVCHDDHTEDEPSVMDVTRSNREVEGLEFNVDDEIDQAADMFITRFRNRMSQSL